MSFSNQFEKITFDIKGVRLPQIQVPSRYETNHDFLSALCEKGLKKIKLKDDLGVYTQRLDYELSIINELGFTDYMLLVWEVINFCHENEIPTGAGRGSAAGSLVLYLIGVTGIDPIEFDLIFERFISKVRAKSQVIDGVRYIDGDLAPDVDLDICSVRRKEVIDYLAEKYKGKFCKLPTVSTLTSRRCVKDVGKAYGNLTEDFMTGVTATIPSLHGKLFSLEKAKKESPQFEKFAKDHPDVYKVARKLEGLIRHTGSHASAYLISYYPFEDFMPIEFSYDKKTGATEVTGSYDMSWAQKECIKLDLLGLKELTTSHAVGKIVGISKEDFDYNDYEKIYKHCEHITLPYGLFQVGADTNFKALQDIKPDNLLGLSDVVAIARPGALDYLPAYILNEHSEHFGNEELGRILSPTHNVPLYQEQALAIANRVFNFSLDDSELLRRAIGKKKKKEMATWEERVYENGKGLGKDISDFFWKLLDDSADYSFNKSHSVCYAHLAAYTIFLKFNYPREFFVECLKMAMNKDDSQELISQIQRELNHFKIKLLQPDLIKSKADFSIEGSDIRFGFSAIKGISDKSLDKVKAFLETEKQNKFEVFNAANVHKVNVGILGALIQAGMLDSVSNDRVKTVYEAHLWSILTPREKIYCLENGEDYDYDLLIMLRDYMEWKKPDGKAFGKESRLNTLRTKADKYREIYKKNRRWPTFANYVYEKKLLGYSYSTNLREVFKDPDLLSVSDVMDRPSQAKVQGVAHVSDFRKWTSKAGNKCMKFMVSDDTEQFEAMMMGNNLSKFENAGNKLGDQDIIFYKARKDDNILWVDEISVQNQKVYMKLSELK